MNLKFSIVVPCYKIEKYINECIESILSQTFKDFELILVDDGSPDKCPEICDSYAKKDSRIKVIHQKNAGLACARNAGIKEAQGEYLICVDGDDYLASEKFLEEISIKAKDGVDVILYGFEKYFESNGAFGEKSIPILNGECNTIEMLNSVLSSNTYCGAAWAKAVRMEVIKQNNIEFKPGMISEDIDWYLKVLCSAKKYDSINQIGLIYRQRPGSITHSAKINSLIDNVWILETWPEIIKEKSENIDYYNALMKVMAYYYANVLILFSGYNRKISKPYKERLKKLSFILDFASTPRAILIKNFYKIAGFNLTVFSLRLMANLKRRK